MNREARTGFIDDLRNCKRCGSLEHENNLRDDLCPNCYYDVDRFKEEREKAKADNKWLNKWQKLKEWVSFTQPKNINDEFISGVCSAYSNVIDKMQELEQELAELKEKAIVPRFKFDEECVVIMFGSYHFHRFIAQVKDDLCLTQPYNDTEEWYYVKPEMVFKTLEEAQAKLKEIQENE